LISSGLTQRVMEKTGKRCLPWVSILQEALQHMIINDIMLLLKWMFESEDPSV
jgi:hypothetical protein